MKAGIFADVRMSDYIADMLGEVPTLNAGACHDLLTRSPLHCWTNHPRLNPEGWKDDANEKADTGSAAHELLIGGESRIVEVPYEDYRKSEAKALRNLAWQDHKTPVLYTKLPPVKRMVEVARDYLNASEIAKAVAVVESEVTLIWQQGDSWCRARPDWLTADRRFHISYKTTAGSAEPESWIRSHLTLDGHDVAAVHYERGCQAIVRANTETIFLVQEQADPFSCSLIGLSPAMRDLASRKLDRAIALWSSSMATGKWPSYSGRIVTAEPAAWMMNQQDEREFHDFELGGQA